MSSGADLLQPGGNEIMEENPRLQRFVEHYKRWPADEKTKCTWENIRERLLANNGHYLALAEAMAEGGLLFGIDVEGNPLVADGGTEPIFKDMNYLDARRAVLFKDQACTESTGYEMFPVSVNNDFDFMEKYRYKNPKDKSKEILDFEIFLDKDLGVFIGATTENASKGSWLESGDEVESAYYAHLNPGAFHTNVFRQDPDEHFPDVGVRRLLRIRKT